MKCSRDQLSRFSVINEEVWGELYVVCRRHNSVTVMEKTLTWPDFSTLTAIFILSNYSDNFYFAYLCFALSQFTKQCRNSKRSHKLKLKQN